MKKIIRKILAGATALTLVAGIAFGCGKSDSANTSEKNNIEVIRVGVMTGGVEHFVLLEGLEKGIYEDNNLKIEFTEFATGVDAVGAIATGQVDVAEIFDFGLINRLGQTSGKSELRIIAQNYVAKTDEATENGLALYVNPDTVKSISDLKGKRISISLGTLNEYQNAKLFEYADLTKDVDITQVPIEAIADVIAVAKNKEIDAAWSSGQHAAALREEGWIPLISGEEVGLVNRNISVARDTFAKKTDTLAKYFAARQQVIDYINSNIDEAATFVSSKTGVTEEQFKNSIITNDATSQINQETYDTLLELKNWSVEQGKFEDFDLNYFINDEALKQTFPDNVNYAK